MNDRKRILYLMVGCLLLLWACQLSGQTATENQDAVVAQEQEEAPPEETPESKPASPQPIEELLGENWRHSGRKTALENLIDEGKVVLEGITVISEDEDFIGEILTIRLTNPTDAPVEVTIQPGQVLLPIFSAGSMRSGEGVLASMAALPNAFQGDWNPMPDFPRMSNYEFLKWWGEMPENFEPTDEQWDTWVREWEIRYGLDADNIPNVTELEMAPVPLVQETMIITTTVWKVISMTPCKLCSLEPVVYAQGEPILIQPGETVEITPFVACIDAGVDAPGPGQEYILGGLASDDLTSFAQCMSEIDFQQEMGDLGVTNIQAAIWYLSDGQMGMDMITDVLEGLGLDESQMEVMKDMFGPAPSEWLARCGFELESE